MANRGRPALEQAEQTESQAEQRNETGAPGWSSPYPEGGHHERGSEKLPRYRVAYMRYVGPYGPHGIPELWKRFKEWMEPRGLFGPDSIRLGIGPDDPVVTAPEKCRYDACVVVPESFAGDKRVNVIDV